MEALARSRAVPAALAGAVCGALLAARLLRKTQKAASEAAQSAPWREAARSPFPLDFTGKRAIVTGAAAGIGRAIAKQLAQHGAQVVAVDREGAALEGLASELPNACLRPAVCDLGDLDAARRTIEEIGPVDFLVNVAGVAIFQPFFEGTPDVWDKTMDINARATWFLTQQVARGMAEHGGGGAVVNISSQSSSVVVSDRHLAYSTSKAAVDHITRSAAIALARHNVRVNAVNPTVVRTELAIKAHGEEGLAKMAAKVPLGRVCEPSHVADTVLFLLSERASMITGITLPVDGGFLAARV